jgi:hypothetical protein
MPPNITPSSKPVGHPPIPLDRHSGPERPRPCRSSPSLPTAHYVRRSRSRGTLGIRSTSGRAANDFPHPPTHQIPTSRADCCATSTRLEHPNVREKRVRVSPGRAVEHKRTRRVLHIRSTSIMEKKCTAIEHATYENWPRWDARSSGFCDHKS